MLASTTRRLLVSGGARGRTSSSSSRQTSALLAARPPPPSNSSSCNRTFAASSSSLADTIQNNERSKAAPLQDVRKQLWEFYLSTGRGANALFEAIDLDENGSIEPSELQLFMYQVLQNKDGELQVDPQELMPYAWNRLEQRAAANQSYDIRAFKKWLVAATKMSADTKNSRLLEFFQLDPATRDQYLSDAEDETTPVVYTWNEESMSQSLRKMQYAVRGEVVMKADQLAAQGKEILYTKCVRTY